MWLYVFFSKLYLASQDAPEVMRVAESLAEWVSVCIDFNDVTLVSEDTYRRLHCCNPDDPDDHDDYDDYDDFDDPDDDHDDPEMIFVTSITQAALV